MPKYRSAGEWRWPRTTSGCRRRMDKNFSTCSLYFEHQVIVLFVYPRPATPSTFSPPPLGHPYYFFCHHSSSTPTTFRPPTFCCPCYFFATSQLPLLSSIFFVLETAAERSKRFPTNKRDAWGSSDENAKVGISFIVSSMSLLARRIFRVFS